MSIGVLVLSILFAGLEALASWLMLAFTPVAKIFAGVPLWLITAIVFSLGMLLSYVLIFIIGGAQITDKAADFVRDHFGRALALMLVSVLVIFGLSSGAEALYQLGEIKHQARMGQKGPVDVCFLLDFSSSMEGEEEGMLKQAFSDTVNGMSDGQNISVVRYDSEAEILYGWHTLNAQTRAEAINTVNAASTDGTTNYNAAFQASATLVNEAISQGRQMAVIMLSDGAPDPKGYSGDLSLYTGNGIKVYTIGIGYGIDFSVLQEIATTTGGGYSALGQFDQQSLSGTMQTATSAATDDGKSSTATADTLLTACYSGRKAIINRAVLRILLLFIVSFVFKLIVNICIGNNDSNIIVHFATAFIVALVGALAVEFGYHFGLPLYVVEPVYWLLMMCQVVFTNR